MPSLLPLALSLVAIALFLVAAVGDCATRRIPNRLVGGLALLGLMRIGLDLAAGGAALAALADLGAALAVFALGALAFRFGALGGGDVKLLAAGALWVGAWQVPAFALSTALAGGLLAVGFTVWLALPLGRDLAVRPSLPYGVAIALGGVLATLPAILPSPV